jgi:hypothetical protein
MPLPKTCQRCHKPFVPVYRQQIFCSSPCAIVLTDEEALLRNTIKTESCWIWTGPIDNRYGRVSRYQKETHRKHRIGAHRLSYSIYIGPLINGMEIHHICNNPVCVNPAHLQQVTHKQHTRLSNSICSINARATHCREGHAYDATNTYLTPNRKGRSCNICRRMAVKRMRARRKLLIA